MDLVVTEGGRSVGYEIKLSNAPKVGKGFWHACEDLGVERAYVVAPVAEPYPLAENVEVISPLMLASIPAVCQGPRTGVAYAQADQTDAKLVEPSRR